MTDEEFDIAHERFRSRASWVAVIVFFAWLAVFLAFGATHQDRFQPHDPKLIMLFCLWLGVFLTVMYFISRWMYKSSGLACPTCGSKEFPTAPDGQCWNCNGSLKVTQKYWPVTVIIGLAGGAVGTIESRNPVRFGSLWLAGFVLVCVGVWWLRRQESKKEHPIAHSKRPRSFSWMSIFILVPLLIAVGFGLVDTIGRPHAARNVLLWLAALVVVSVGGAWMRRKEAASEDDKATR
jgi:membrane protein DedA with SNARE-associated domain